MNLKIFKSGKGDCLLISSKDQKHMLVDGGLKTTFRNFTADHIRKSALGQLDIVCISHIDSDHIAGILGLLDSVIDWRIYHHCKNQGLSARKPSWPEPADIKEIWHNGFKAQAGSANTHAESLVNTLNTMSFPDFDTDDPHAGPTRLETSFPQGIALSYKIDPATLNIPLNTPTGGDQLFYNNQTQPINLGAMTIHLIGPHKRDLDKLQKQWNDWVEDNAKKIQDLKEASLRDARDFGNALSDFFLSSDDIGDRSKVTTPNLASIMFLVEEDGKTILMTGDGHSDDILKGLRDGGHKTQNQGMHVDVLKLQHHGAEFNLDEHFCKEITADHYVFCGNGEHHNPDLEALEIILKSRVGTPAEKSKNPTVDNPFKFWFNSSPTTVTTTLRKKHMTKVQNLIRRYKSRHVNFSYDFINKNQDFLKIEL